jgi:hypothetical protein
MVNMFSVAITTKTALLLIIVMVSVMIVDTTIVKFFTFTNEEFRTSSNIAIFVIFSLIFAFSTTLLIRSLKKSESKYSFKHELNLKYSYSILSFCQYLIIVILAFISLQTNLLRSYNIFSLYFAVYVIYISAILFLIFLISMLVGWFRSNRSHILILYAVSFSAMVLNILVSLIYLTFQFSRHISSGHVSALMVQPFPIHFSLISLPGSELANSFGVSLDVLSLLSFMLTWIATAKLLSQYRHRIGKIRYWTIISIPLLYFLFPFETYFVNVFQPYMLDSPVIFGIIYLLVFSATKQVGGILFSMVFLTASITIKRPRLRNSLLITGMGMAILYGSVEIDTLPYVVFPPFNLVTISFMPIGSYLLFVGIFTSARRVSDDAHLRKEFYKSAESHMSLLKTIGVTEMEKQIMKRCKPLIDRSAMLEKPEDQELEQQDVKEMIHDVLNELKERRQSY